MITPIMKIFSFLHLLYSFVYVFILHIHSFFYKVKNQIPFQIASKKREKTNEIMHEAVSSFQMTNTPFQSGEIWVYVPQILKHILGKAKKRGNNITFIWGIDKRIIALECTKDNIQEHVKTCAASYNRPYWELGCVLSLILFFIQRL